MWTQSYPYTFVHDGSRLSVKFAPFFPFWP
jgi:hypothetical protein